ncbi:MAG TPA: MMPL family transporter [Conexibacter sp.]|jgi:hypothetical protein
MRAVLERVARAAARRPVVTLLLVALLALGGGLLALGLHADTSADSFASRSSETGKATADYHRDFGDDAILVLVREHVSDLVLTDDLGRMLQLEGCLGGNIPSGATPYGGANSACGQLAQLKPVQVVYGPGTFLNEASNALQDEMLAQIDAARTASEQARRAAVARAKQQHWTAAQQRRAGDAAAKGAADSALINLQQLMKTSGLNGAPQLDNRAFVSQVVFDPAIGADVPKARFAYLFPSPDSALVQVRLRPDLSSQERERTISLVRAAVRMPMFRLSHGGTYTVSGVPVVVDDLAGTVTHQLTLLLGAAVAAMALVLLLIFRARPRLLPLVIALAASGITFGAMRLASVQLTMASIAVLPVLIGLAVDYAIQFQSRVQEARAEGLEGSDAVARAARVGAPTIATAALATAVGFLVLLLSPVPMVRGFGLLLVAGIAVAFAVTLTGGAAALALGRRRAPRRKPRRRVPNPLDASLAGADEIVSGFGGGATRRLLSLSQRRPGRILALAAVLAIAGWAVETQTDVVSDVTKLVPADMPALADLTAVQDATRSSGEIDVVVRGSNVATPAVLAWMGDYQARVLRRLGYSAAQGCASASVCPALSLPDLFDGSPANSQRAIDAVLDTVPPYFASAVLRPDRQAATLAFGIRLMPLDEQQRVIDAMRAELDPPNGVDAQLAGLPVVTAQANAQLSSASRRLLTVVLGLLAVGAVLLAVFRSASRALVPLVPIAFATGWSALVLFASQVPLNPLSATLGALVVAISTEFSVLLSERFRQERAAGREVADALTRAYRSTGRAVIASGVTAIAGFGVLAFSDIRMLRDFGIVTVVDLAVSLLGVLIVLPSVLVLAERGAFARLAPRLPRARRRAGRRPGSPVS